MTTSDHPRADRRDDDPGEHRGLGKRILDAVLGDPADARPDPRHDDPAGGTDPRADTRHDPAGEARRDAGPAGYVDRDEARRDAGYDARDTAGDARRDVGDTRFVDDGRRDAGYDDPASRLAGREPGRDPLAPDAPHDLDPAGYEDRRPADRQAGLGTTAAPGATGTTAGSGAGQDFVTSSYDPDRDTGYDPQAAGTAVAGRGDARTDADRDFVTGSYDPDRDRGYDPQAAGTAMDPADGPVARNTHRDRDTGSRTGTNVDYDPTHDTGYVDADRAGTDRATGHRDADYDTGRVDADRPDDDRRHGGAAAAGGIAAVAGAAVAAGAALRHRDGGDRHGGSAQQGEFSEVDDTATVDGTPAGRPTPDRPDADRAAAGRAEAVAEEDDGSGGRERLIPADRARDYDARWNALKGDFVDEPRRAVTQADDLVGEVLDEIQRLFGDQRRGLEQSFDHDQASTEDLRLALRRYRSFFDRLLSF